MPAMHTATHRPCSQSFVAGSSLCSLPRSQPLQHIRYQHRRCIAAAAASDGAASRGGFGKPAPKPAPKKKATETAPVKKAAAPKVQAPSPPPAGATLGYTATAEQLASGTWIDVLPGQDMNAFFEAAKRDVKAITLQAGRTLVLYRHKGVVYCSDVNSTAYQFPMVDAKIVEEEPSGPAVEVPLDGTVYDLRTGKVLKWCPKGEGLLRNVFATLKRSATPVDLSVFATHTLPGGGLRIRLAD